MGALYHLKQKLVDFCNVIQENVSRTDTVPSSKVVYDLKADTDADIQELNTSLSGRITQVTKTMTTNANGYIAGAGNGFTPYNLLDAKIIGTKANHVVIVYTYDYSAYLVPTDQSDLTKKYANTTFTYLLTLLNLNS